MATVDDRGRKEGLGGARVASGPAVGTSGSRKAPLALACVVVVISALGVSAVDPQTASACRTAETPTGATPDTSNGLTAGSDLPPVYEPGKYRPCPDEDIGYYMRYEFNPWAERQLARAGEFDCLTGTDAGGANAAQLIPPAERFARPLLPGPFAIVAPLNQRFGLLTTQGALLFKPSVPSGGWVATVPTKRGVSIWFIPGISQPGRYRWLLPLEPGQRVTRQRGRLVVQDIDRSPLAVVKVRRRKVGTVHASADRSIKATRAQSEDPPSAGPDGSDGFYVDYAAGTDIEALSVVPAGDPSPFDCKAVQTPGHQDAPPPEPGDASVDMSFEDDGPPAMASHNGPRAQAALAICRGTVYKPFKAGALPGFFGYEYGRTTLGCAANARVQVKVQTVRISGFSPSAGAYKERRTRTQTTFGGSTRLAQTRTVCRNSSDHRWRTGGRFTVFALKRPYIQSALRRAYSINGCA